MQLRITREFTFPIRVYYEDTDSGGVVYYANYLKFMERARTEYLRSLGFEQDQLIADDGVLFVVRSIQVDYLRPARFNQLLQVSAQVAEIGKASLLFAQRVLPAQSEDLRDGRDAGGRATQGEVAEMLCTGQVKVACLDARTLRPVAIPPRMLLQLLEGDAE